MCTDGHARLVLLKGILVPFVAEKWPLSTGTFKSRGQSLG